MKKVLIGIAMLLSTTASAEDACLIVNTENFIRVDKIEFIRRNSSKILIYGSTLQVFNYANSQSAKIAIVDLGKRIEDCINKRRK